MSAGDGHGTKLLFVAGTGRSGTTILSTILGQVPGCFSVGEVRYIWERGFGENHRCGCGEPFDTCPVWSEVVQKAFGPDGPPDPNAVSADLLRRLRMLRVPAMVARKLRGRPAVPPDPFDDAVGAIYRALDETQHPGVIIDSSKLPPYGTLLERLPGVEFYVVHIVRDPRATAFSWRRLKATKDTEDGEAVMERLELWRSSVMWVVWNYLVELWWSHRDGRYVRLRYEDFVERPAEHVQKIARMLGLDGADEPFVGKHAVSVRPTHSVAGNPNRHDTGTVTLRPDVEWRRGMPARSRAVVTLFSLPGLRRFGYTLRT
jgi:hypothetical protein